MNKLLILIMISSILLFLPIMVQASVPTPPKSKQYDLIRYDYVITDEDGELIDEQFDLWINLTLEDDWHYYLEGREVSETTAYKDRDDNIHTFIIMQIVPCDPDIIPDEPDSGADPILSFLEGGIQFIMDEFLLILIGTVVLLWLLSHLRM